MSGWNRRGMKLPTTPATTAANPADTGSNDNNPRQQHMPSSHASSSTSASLDPATARYKGDPSTNATKRAMTGGTVRRETPLASSTNHQDSRQRMPQQPSPSTVPTSTLSPREVAATPSGKGKRALAHFPPEVQEQTMLRDLLYILMGVDGVYLRKSQAKSSLSISFRLPAGLDMAVKRMVERILPSCKNHALILHFLEASPLSSHGRVNQALAEALRTIMKDYHILIAQLETQLNKGKLTLQSFQFGLQPSLPIVEKLASVVSSILTYKCTGGRTLSILHQIARDTIGMGKVHNLCFRLATKASEPYLEMVTTWLHEGVLAQDDDDEFLIVVSGGSKARRGRSAQPNMSTANRAVDCALRPKDTIPSFLLSVSEMILETGRQVQILSTFSSLPSSVKKQAGMPSSENGGGTTAQQLLHQSQLRREAEREQAERASQRQKDKNPLVYSLQEHTYAAIIQTAYDSATAKLLHALKHDFQIVKRLASVKRYFSMEQSDVFIHFLTSAESDLRCPRESVSVDRLSSLLELALFTSSARTDPFKDDLRCTLASTQLITELFSIIHLAQQSTAEEDDDKAEHRFVEFPGVFEDISASPAVDLSGFDLFTLHYNIQWPTSLILDHHTVKRYQFLFRQIFAIKYVERQLSSVALSSCAVRRAKLPWMQRAFALRQKMLNFVLTLQNYMLIEVVEQHWREFLDASEQVTTLDGLVRAHDSYLDACLRKCMLTNRSLLKTISKILRLSNLFATYLEKFVAFAESEVALAGTSRRSSSVTPASLAAKGGSRNSSRELVAKETVKLEEGYSALIGELIHTLTAVAALENEQGLSRLVLLLNFNGFYDEKVESAEYKQRQMATEAHSQRRAAQRERTLGIASSPVASKLAAATTTPPQRHAGSYGVQLPSSSLASARSGAHREEQQRGHHAARTDLTTPFRIATSMGNASLATRRGQAGQQPHRRDTDDMKAHKASTTMTPSTTTSTSTTTTAATTMTRSTVPPVPPSAPAIEATRKSEETPAVGDRVAQRGSESASPSVPQLNTPTSALAYLRNLQRKANAGL